MSQKAKNWMKLILLTGEYADVHFLVGDGEEKERISAHKLILKNASDVFEAMFRFDANKERTENAAAGSHVEVPDVEPTAFKVMLSFIYADDLSELDGDNAMAVLYTAKKYNIPDLVGPSLQIPIAKLRNVFFACAQAHLFDLEFYTDNCLSYIDKNAESLLKSEEFLQIHQNLLCEILARDKLQISGEISIWKAVNFIFKPINYKVKFILFINFLLFLAFRWADAKCRQIGIECSANNFRQMLGPALFKIRFPLLSKMQFSQQIVPSGILTADEVVGVEQYHNHPNPTMPIGILYPMQFPINERIWKTKATLTMEIENFLEFAPEKLGNCKFSEPTHIRGLPFQIMVKMNTKSGSTDEKCLGFYLQCTSKNEYWRCVCSATFRIVSQNNGADNCTGICEAVLYKSWGNWSFDRIFQEWGSDNFISFAELMDPNKGLYDKNVDKLALAIDVAVPNEREQRTYRSNGTIEMEIENLSEFALEAFGSGRFSESVLFIKGLPWKIMAQINSKNRSTDQKWLGFYLWCAAGEKGRREEISLNEWNSHSAWAENWSCKCSATFRIISQKHDVPDFSRDFSGQVFNTASNSSGFQNFIAFSELMDTSKGFYNKNQDNMKLTIDFIVKEANT
ncbi:hypothetical protein niasHT_028461 [Heterodera trifolii]|uniref:BTB domain-containing protein n=1 Tax=Heterodera trifolii TaxID=157864 RepID=A0ABD2KQ69_9BILA